LPAVVVKMGPQAGRRVELAPEVVIGRQNADLVLEDPEVSRRHAVVRRSGGSAVVEDLHSTNGTFVNGERIRESVTIRAGDELRVGQTTLEIEADAGVDETVVSTPVRPDLISRTKMRASRDAVSTRAPRPVSEREESTQPLPHRTPKRGSRPVASNKSRLPMGIAVLAAIVGVIAYAALTARPAQSGFTARANDACAAVQRSGEGVDLSSDPTRGELEHARTLRLQALGAMRAAGRPEDNAEQVARFLSAFGETNASITRLQGAIGSHRAEVGRALRRLRDDVRVESELATKAGISACGGLAIG
jgi:pSer/pThr/pTyr-binding forkhead associated (FHA) protein